MVLLMVAGGWCDWRPSFYPSHEMVLLMVAWRLEVFPRDGPVDGCWKLGGLEAFLLPRDGPGSSSVELSSPSSSSSSVHISDSGPKYIPLTPTHSPKSNHLSLWKSFCVCETSGQEERRNMKVLTTLTHTMYQDNSNFGL